MGQSRLASFSVLRGVRRVARGIDFDNVINQFAILKSRRADF